QQSALFPRENYLGFVAIHVATDDFPAVFRFRFLERVGSEYFTGYFVQVLAGGPAGYAAQDTVIRGDKHRLRLVLSAARNVGLDALAGNVGAGRSIQFALLKHREH